MVQQLCYFCFKIILLPKYVKKCFDKLKLTTIDIYVKRTIYILIETIR